MDNEFDFKSILVPYNATPGAKRGLKAAIKLAQQIDGQITLLTCIENQPFLSFFKKDSKKEKFEQEKKIIANELKKLSSNTEINKPIKQVILKSSFAPNTIIEYTENNPVDIVVIGQTKLLTTEGKYHESMANYLLKDLKCPLLVIK